MPRNGYAGRALAIKAVQGAALVFRKVGIQAAAGNVYLGVLGSARVRGADDLRHRHGAAGVQGQLGPLPHFQGFQLDQVPGIQREVHVALQGEALGGGSAQAEHNHPVLGQGNLCIGAVLAAVMV